MVKPLRNTGTLRGVVRLLYDNRDEDMHGLRICMESGIGPGTVYPLLSRMEAAGWVTSRWEDEQDWLQPADGKHRPRRRYYTLTGDGARATEELLASKPNVERRPLGAAVKATWAHQQAREASL